MKASPIEQQMYRAGFAMDIAESEILAELHNIGCSAKVVCGSIIIPPEWQHKVQNIIDNALNNALQKANMLNIHKEIV